MAPGTPVARVGNGKTVQSPVSWAFRVAETDSPAQVTAAVVRRARGAALRLAAIAFANAVHSAGAVAAS